MYGNHSLDRYSRIEATISGFDVEIEIARGDSPILPRRFATWEGMLFSS